MSAVRKSLGVIGVVAGMAGCLLIGSIARTATEVGPQPRVIGPAGGSDILASATNPTRLPDGEFFYQLTLLLKRQFVEPINDDTTLAVGAVRGMVNSLADPNSNFMNKEQFAQFREKQQGVFEGIGVEVRFLYDSEQLKIAQERVNEPESAEPPPGLDPLLLLPDVVISAVAPGSPAARAGIEVGDRVTQINGKFLVSARDIRRLRELQTAVTAGRANQAELARYRSELNDRLDNAMTPNRARDLLIQGIGQDVKLSVARGDKNVEAQMRTAKVVLSPVEQLPDGSVSLRFFKGAGKALEDAKLPDGAVIDLRNSTMGDFTEVEPVLRVLAPATQFGVIKTMRPADPKPLETKQGIAKPQRYTLRVDASVRGAAAVFALAMQARGFAVLEGPAVETPALWITTYPLPEGAGYTLTTGEFQPEPVATTPAGGGR